MIVRLQNQSDTRLFHEPHIKQSGTAYSVCMRIKGRETVIECGRYLEESRAMGVLYEMLDAYKRKERIFYMPAA